METPTSNNLSKEIEKGDGTPDEKPTVKDEMTAPIAISPKDTTGNKSKQGNYQLYIAVLFLKLIHLEHMQHFIPFFQKRRTEGSHSQEASQEPSSTPKIQVRNSEITMKTNNRGITVAKQIIYAYSLSLCSQMFFIQMNRQEVMPKETNLSTKHLQIVLPRPKCKIRPTTNHKLITQKNV